LISGMTSGIFVRLLRAGVKISPAAVAAALESTTDCGISLGP
jgi:hypothetical protein